MSLNLGLEGLTISKENANSQFDMLSAYIAFADFNSKSDAMFNQFDKLCTTFDNIAVLGKVVKKYNGSAEALSILNELTFDDFKGQLSLEGLAETAKAIWDKIINFFAKLIAIVKAIGKISSAIIKGIITVLGTSLVNYKRKLIGKGTIKFKPFTYTGISPDDLNKFGQKINQAKITQSGVRYDELKLDDLTDDIDKINQFNKEVDDLVSQHDVKTLDEFQKLTDWNITGHALGSISLFTGDLMYFIDVQKTLEKLRAQGGQIETAKKIATKYAAIAKLYKNLAWKLIRTLYSIAFSSKLVNKENLPDASKLKDINLPNKQ